MNQPTSLRSLTDQRERSWHASTQNAQHASPRNLTVSPHTTRRVALAEESKEKEKEVATVVNASRDSWLRPSGDFTPAPEFGRPSGGSSPVIHYFVEQKTGSCWIGKLGQVPLRDREVIEAARRLPGFLGVYADEILEKLGLAVYQLLGTEVPESALSYQQVTMEAMHPDMLLAMQLNAEDEGRLFELPRSPRMHYLSRYVEEFRPLDKNFVEHYLSNAKRCGSEYVRIHTIDGETLPLRGLGSMLAAADFVYDLDCLGDSCGNAGYVIREDRVTRERYAQLVKIDAGYAFSYSDLRTDQKHNPKDRHIRVAPNQLRLQFADLSLADQKEFAAAAKRILSIPYEEFAHLFSQTEGMEEGIPAHHWQQLLNELIARKSLFLKAFAPETDRTIVNEIEAAQAKVAKKFEHTEEISAQVAEELLEQEKAEAKALAELRVRLAVVDGKESEDKKVGECKTFQLPGNKTHFVGREEALAQVVLQLNEANGSVIGQSISGIGGVGKTQLALHYAQAAANGEAIGGQYLGYDYVVWLNAEMFLEGQFQAMAELWTGEYLKADEAIEAVYRHLRGKRTLLVFDNAENARAIASFLPHPHHASPVHFLITSRNAQWGGLPTVKLGGFSLEEAQEYVEYHLGPQSKEAVAKLAELLGGLPLAISQAVSYIKAGHSTLEGFEEQYHLNQASLLSHELLEEDHPKTVGTTLTLCLAQAKVKSSLVEKLLGLVAYFAADGIKVDLVARGLEVSKEEVNEGLEVLESYSLVSRSAGGLQVHRLVQEVIRHRHKFLREPHRYWNRVVELLSGVVVNDKNNVEGMKQCSHAIAHVKQVAELSKRVGLSQEQELKLADLLAVSGLNQNTLGNYEVARVFQEQALEIGERHYGPDHAAVASTLVNLGNACGSLGDARKKKELLERALRIEEPNYGPEHVEVAKTLTSLGIAYGDLGETRKKKELLERALHILETRYGPEHVEVASTLGNLGVLYGELGDTRKMKDLLERALRIFEIHYGPEHVEVASTLGNLGIAYGDLGDTGKKKDLLERALSILEIHYGPEHVEVAITLTNLGGAYEELGDARKKKDLLERALRIKETHYGSEHVEVAKTLTNLGNAYGELGDARKKKDLLERALSILEIHYGPEHVEVAVTLGNLGVAYGELGDARKLKDLLERALRILEIYYGPEHVEVASTLMNLGVAYGKLGNVQMAKKHLERALIIKKKHYGKDHLQVGKALFNLTYACLALKQILEARDYAKRAFSIFKECLGEQHLNTEKAKQLLSYIDEQMISGGFIRANFNSIKTTASAETDLGRPNEPRKILFSQVVNEWMRELELFLDQRDSYGYQQISAVSVIGKALTILQTKEWEKFLEDPNFYGILPEIADQLDEFKKEHSILGEVGDFPELVEELLTHIVARKSDGDNHVEKKTREKEKEKESPIRANDDQEIGMQQARVFKEVVAGWVEALEAEILESGLVSHYEPQAARSFVGTALHLLWIGRWNELERDPESCGIPEKLLPVLKAYKARNPILEQIAASDPELTKEVYQMLLYGFAPNLESRFDAIWTEKEKPDLK